MIRFLIGCLLAIVLLWSVLLTVGFFAGLGHRAAPGEKVIHRPS